MWVEWGHRGGVSMGIVSLAFGGWRWEGNGVGGGVGVVLGIGW